MKNDQLKEKIQHIINTELSNLNTNPLQQKKLFEYATQQHAFPRSTPTAILVLSIILTLLAATALAVSLSGYFNKFAHLESSYGDYDQWPNAAKVELAQVMIDSNMLSADNNWYQLDQTEKEIAAEKMLDNFFSNMLYKNTFTVMEQQLGSFRNWSTENRALYSALIEKYGEHSWDWTAYHLPQKGDITEQEAILKARQAILDSYWITEDMLDSYTPVYTYFMSQGYNDYGLPADEPYWYIEFGDAKFTAAMTRVGNLLMVHAQGTQDLMWGIDPLSSAQIVTPSPNEVSYEDALSFAHNALTEVVNISASEVDSMNATAQLYLSHRYVRGKEPVWIITYSTNETTEWRVLLTHDGKYLDAAPQGKEFLHVLRRDTSLFSLWEESCNELGVDSHFINSQGAYYYQWSFEEKAAFSQVWKPVVEEYESVHPYFDYKNVLWQWTRNVNGIPAVSALSLDEAKSIALSYMQDITGNSIADEDVFAFYFITNPTRPEWRFLHYSQCVALDAYTGELLLAQDIDISAFLEIIIE